MRLWNYVRAWRTGKRDEAARKRATARRLAAIAFERYELEEIEREGAERPREVKPARGVRKAAEPASVEFGSIRAFMADEIEAAGRDERLRVAAAFECYVRWCNSWRLPPANIMVFADEFERACQADGAAIRAADGSIFCYGLRFVTERKARHSHTAPVSSRTC